MLGRFATLGLVFASAVSLMPACSSTANVSDVYISLDEDGARRRNQFTTDTANIFCMIEYSVGRKDVTIEVTIKRTNADGVTIVAATDIHPDITKDTTKHIPLGVKVPRFSLDENGRLKEDDEAPYEVGRYRCDVKLDGQLKSFAEFDVSFPDCPTAQIIQGSRCAGFYEIPRECPRAGNAGDQEPTCSCTLKGWNCPK